jgi:hypothetical protein
MARRNPNLLLVEGRDEQYLLPFFMDHYVEWGDRKDDWIVEIKELDGIENLLRPGVIEAESKTPGLKALGVIVDANDSLASRWMRVRERFRRISSNFPNEPVSTGLIHVTPDGLRVGVWIMPDNRSSGMLETFMGFLLSPDRSDLWDLVQASCDRAIEIPDCFSPSHRDKARIHTFLAWIEPPGLSLPHAVLKRAFDVELPHALSFARWFMSLYQINPRPGTIAINLPSPSG